MEKVDYLCYNCGHITKVEYNQPLKCEECSD